jgi:hypothetical protein
MYIIFFLLSVISLICLLIGVIKPGVMRLRSRKIALYIFGSATFVLFILFAVTAPPTEKIDATAQSTNVEAKTNILTSEKTSVATSSTAITSGIKPTSTSSSTVSSAQYGVRTQTSGCTADQALPDPECTPGAILTTDKSIICVAGYTKTVRDVPDSVRQAVFKEYGIDYSLHSNYEVDHLISLELGGSNDISNLFPEGYSISHGALEKDKFENYLHSKICDGSITVQAAQNQIATDWLKYYLLAFPTKTTTAPQPQVQTQSQPQVTESSTPDSEPQVKKSSTGICHEKGTTYYARTQNYTPYASIQACLDSGGRLPK